MSGVIDLHTHSSASDGSMNPAELDCGGLPETPEPQPPRHPSRRRHVPSTRRGGGRSIRRIRRHSAPRRGLRCRKRHPHTPTMPGPTAHWPL